jgi:hypothetical protein
MAHRAHELDGGLSIGIRAHMKDNERQGGEMKSEAKTLVALTIGHSTRTIEEFVRLLHAHAQDSGGRRADGALFEAQSSVQSRHLA